MKKKKSNKKLLKNRLLSIINLVVTILFIILIIKLNILPTLYLVIGIIILLALNFVNIFINFRKIKSKIIKAILSFISLVSIICYGVASFYIIRTINFTSETLTFKGQSTKNYSIIVLKESPFNELKDLNNKGVGFLKLDEYSYNVINKDLTVDKYEYENATVLKEKLFTKEVEAMVVENSYVDIYKEEEEDFETKIKTIYTFSVDYKIDNFVKEADITKETFTIFISGIDTYGQISSVSRSDVNMLVTVNPKTHQILLTSVPRDTYVQLYKKKGYKDKLTHAGIYGIETSVKTLESFLDVDINYYIKVNFTSLIKIVNALGGVTVYSKYDFSTNNGWKNGPIYRFKQGYNNLNGEQALVFARTRKAFTGGDRVRGENQQALIEAIIRKACSTAIITNYSSILDSLKGTFDTNLEYNKITELIKYQIDKMPKWKVISSSVDGTDSYEFTYSYPDKKLYVMISNEESLNNAKQIIKDIYNGKKLESSYSSDVSGASNVTVTPSKNTSNVQKNEVKEPLKENNIVDSNVQENIVITENEIIEENNLIE